MNCHFLRDDFVPESSAARRFVNKAHTNDKTVSRKKHKKMATPTNNF